jgi:hypothetical protein
MIKGILTCTPIKILKNKYILKASKISVKIKLKDGGKNSLCIKGFAIIYSVS